ncbi:MAG TPA: OsmC family protein, partial [Methylomirabilota bacterium]
TQQMTTDGDGQAGPSPVQLLGISLAGCMASDVAHILVRGRQELTSLEVTLEAERAGEPPRRFVSIRLHFAARGAVDPPQLARAIALSREKYCSVWHTLRPDIPLEITSTIVPAS